MVLHYQRYVDVEGRKEDIVVDNSVLRAVCERVKSEYQDHLFTRQSYSYLIGGGIVNLKGIAVGLIHESREGLEKLAQMFDLPAPIELRNADSQS